MNVFQSLSCVGVCVALIGISMPGAAIGAETAVRTAANTAAPVASRVPPSLRQCPQPVRRQLKGPVRRKSQ